MLGPLRINEIVSSNDGVWVDEAGETDDVIELVNTGDERVWLDEFTLGDEDDEETRLPAIPLAPGERAVFFADGTTEQGDMHLPFKVSATDGEQVYLRDRDGTLRDRFTIPALDVDASYARFPDGVGDPITCRYATPGRSNGETCGPPPRDVGGEPPTYQPFAWPDPFPARNGPLAISELALRPASFVELVNVTQSPVALAGFSLRLAPTGPGLPWPTSTEGVALPLEGELAPGARIAVPVATADVAAIAATEHFEGVATLFEGTEARERVDFMAWPEGTVLARLPANHDRFALCRGETRGQPNDTCEPIASRPVPGRLRHLYTPGDYAALAAGGTEIGQRAVKVIVDMQAGDVVHLLGSRAWDLHYTFVRELIDHEQHLDRCDPAQNSVFYRGWSLFSRQQYGEPETRRYLLGTLVEHTGTEYHTLDFETGDAILPTYMRRAFFAIAPHLDAPELWAIRPQSAAQDAKVRSIEGTVPIVAENAPLRDVTMQPLTPAVGFGLLLYVPAGELDRAPLGRDVIVVTDDVPNDIPLVGGLITEAIQTPLSHVNVLSRGRGTPNMSLRGARTHDMLAPNFDQLVRLEVTESGFDVRRAEPSEAEAFWAERRPTGPRLVPRSDTSVRGVIPLENMSRADIPSIGGKAAQFAELMNIVSTRPGCEGPIPVPRDAFAIPLVHYMEHFAASGAESILAELLADETFRTDPLARGQGLARLRQAILDHPVDAALLAEVEDAVRARFGTERVRFRSSSNIEDLQEFNGAGLYTSTSGDIDDDERRVDDAIRTVWASLWRQRAYDEREEANVEQTAAAMGVLCHLAHLGEVANGIAVSRDIFDPTRGDIYYFNLQIGEASVANPAPGVATEELLYRWGRDPRVVHQGRSSLTQFDVMDTAELDRAACTIASIHDAFRRIIDPLSQNRWFAVDIEFKLVRDGRGLVIKQARPYSFGDAEIPADCREF